jgi:hypothetical protein
MYNFQPQNLDLNRIYNIPMNIVAAIIKPFILSDTCYYFTNDYKIIIPETISVVNNNKEIKKTISYNYCFDKSLVITLKDFDLSTESGLIIPLFECKEFVCMSCNKLHDLKSNQCCDFNDSKIHIKKAKLVKITIPSIEDYREAVEQNKKDFIRLHFPDLVDTIMLR